MIPKQTEAKQIKGPNETQPIDTSEVRKIAEEVVGSSGYITKDELKTATADFVTADTVNDIVDEKMKSFEEKINEKIGVIEKLVARVEGAVETLVTHRDAALETLQEGHTAQESRIALLEANNLHLTNLMNQQHKVIYGGNGTVGLLMALPKIDKRLSSIEADVVPIKDYIKAQIEKAKKRAAWREMMKEFIKSSKGMAWIGASGGVGTLLKRLIDVL